MCVAGSNNLIQSSRKRLLHYAYARQMPLRLEIPLYLAIIILAPGRIPPVVNCKKFDVFSGILVLSAGSRWPVINPSIVLRAVLSKVIN